MIKFETAEPVQQSIIFETVNVVPDVVPAQEIKRAEPELTIECQSVQMKGLEACSDCILRDTPCCGGKRIRETGKNRNGFTVPIWEVI